MSQSMLAQLLSKLAAISPMPSDETLLEGTAELVDQYYELIEEIGQHLTEERPAPAEEAQVVRVLADSFGPDSGLGTFWGTLHLIERCTPSIAIPILQDRALHGLPGTRVWCAFILGRRRNSEDLPLFLTLLHDNVPEVQIQALSSLVMLSQAIPLQHALPSVYPLLEHPDPRVRKEAHSAIEAIGMTQRDSSDRP